MQITSDEIARLSPEERLDLIGQLWDSLSDADIPLTPAQQEEVKRRLAMADQEEGITWEELKAKLARR